MPSPRTCGKPNLAAISRYHLLLVKRPLVARNTASDKEAVFLYIVCFIKAGMNLFVKVRSRFFFILLYRIFVTYFLRIFELSQNLSQ